MGLLARTSRARARMNVVDPNECGRTPMCWPAAASWIDQSARAARAHRVSPTSSVPCKGRVFDEDEATKDEDDIAMASQHIGGLTTIRTSNISNRETQAHV